MGYYIEVPEHKNKAAQIEQLYDGTIIPQPDDFSKVPADKALIVGVINPLFDAAAFAFDEDEFSVFTDPTDRRPKTFILIDRELAIKLSGIPENLLACKQELVEPREEPPLSYERILPRRKLFIEDGLDTGEQVVRYFCKPGDVRVAKEG